MWSGGGSESESSRYQSKKKQAPPPPPAEEEEDDDVYYEAEEQDDIVVDDNETAASTPRTSTRAPTLAPPKMLPPRPKGVTPPKGESPKRDREPAVSLERAMVAEWERDLRDIVVRAMEPLVRFVGAVAVKSRRDYIRASMKNVVSEGAQTVVEFVDANGHLGRTLLSKYLDQAPTEPPQAAQEQQQVAGPARATVGGVAESGPAAPVQAPFDLADLDQSPAYLAARFQKPTARYLRQRIRDERDPQIRRGLEQHLMRVTALETLEDRALEMAFAPAWAFEVLGDPLWRRIVDNTTLAAMNMAHAKVRRIEGCSSFTLKELICSDDVSDQFAFLVAAEWLNAGDDSTTTSRQRGARGRYLNLNMYRTTLGNELYVCSIWFESVYARANPLLHEFARRKAERLAKINDPARRAQVALSLDAYGAMLPRRELVYRGGE